MALFFQKFISLLEKLPFKIYLITNEKMFNDKRVNVINVGNDISWSHNLKCGLNQIEKDYALLMIDDLLLNKSVSNEYFYKIANWINSHSPDHFRLHISSKPFYFDNIAGYINSKSPYLTSTMPAIWKKTSLLNILRNGENTWDFEILGSNRARKDYNFFSVYRNFVL